MPEPIEITNMKNNCDNREYVIEAVKVQGSLLEFASDKLKSDRDVVFESVSKVRVDVLLCKRKSFIRQRIVNCRTKE